MQLTIKNICTDKTAHQPSMAVAFEFVSSWTMASEDPAILARLSAGAIGVCIDHLNILPPYRPNKTNPTKYGHECLQRLLERAVPTADIFGTGTQCLQYLASILPKQEEVEEEQDFLDSRPVDS